MAQQTTAWFNLDPTTGEEVAESEDGGHQAITEAIVVDETEDSYIVGYVYQSVEAWDIQIEEASISKAYIQAVKDGVQKFAPYDLVAPLFAAAFVFARAAGDPPLAPLVMDLNLPFVTSNASSFSLEKSEQATQANGSVGGTVQPDSLTASGSLRATWASATTGTILVSSLGAARTTVVDSAGTTVGSGPLTLSSQIPASASISGTTQWSLAGQGSLAFYGPAWKSLGASGDFQNYTATVTGNVSIALTVLAGALTLSGQPLPAGTYTITTNSATLSGSGTMSSPNFAGTASITATNGTVNIGPGTGTLSVSGKQLDPTDETTLDGYNGTVTVSASGNGADSVSLSGSAGNLLQVAASPQPGGGGLVTDRSTPISFAADVQTSLADTYSITVNAPQGWTVSIDSNGNVTATPAPGLQSGTYPVQIIAQSQQDSNLEAQTTVDVTISPTQPGMNFTVAPDTQFTVPDNGAQLPTAFRASIQNLGPSTDTFNLSFSTVPSGFTIANSGTSDTVPAGATGIVGLYLVPSSGQPIPAPGTQVSFTVTATSMSDPSITQTQTETFTVPDIDAVTVAANPSAVSTIPGSPVSTTVTLTNVGNVTEDNIALTDTLPSGLTLTGLAPVSLAVGQSTTEIIALTPDASIPLNSILDATVTATFGPSASPVSQTVDIPMSVAVAGRRRDRQCCDQRGAARQHQPRRASKGSQHGAYEPGPEPDQRSLPEPGSGQPERRRGPARRRSLSRRVGTYAEERRQYARTGRKRGRRPICRDRAGQ